MTGARGQSSRTLLDREYPHQVLVAADNVRGKALEKVLDFHAKLGIPVKSRTLRKDDVWCKLYYLMTSITPGCFTSCLVANWSLKVKTVSPNMKRGED
jgi:hypothetical protein